MSARDELAVLLERAGELGPSTVECLRPQDAKHYADAILAAGYTKPRTITTAEELDGLADDSVVLDDMDGPLTKVGAWWHAPSDEMRSNDVILPTTVLYEPAP